MDLNGALPPELLGAIGGAGGLAVLYAGVRLMSVCVKFVDDRFMHHATLAKVEVEQQVAEQQVRVAREEAERVGVGTLGEMVIALRDQVVYLTNQMEALKLRERTFRGIVLRFVAEISRILPDMPVDIRSRVKAAIEQLKTEADLD